MGKRDKAAKLAGALGLTRVLELLPQKPYLVILNYHRIGYPEKTEYDPGVFSATPEDFDAQMAYLSAHFEVISLEGVEQFLSGSGRKRAALLITFDDGYIDNYQIAFPILRKWGLSATFFVPTSFIGSKIIPWWDGIGHAVRTTSRRKVKLSYPSDIELDLEQLGPREAARRLCNLLKSPDVTDTARFLQMLAEACGVTWRAEGEQLFMDWAQVAEMYRAGMCIGSHSHHHDLFSKLPLSTQRAELETSRDIIREEIGFTPTAFAYPTGIPGCFTAEVFPVLEDLGYRMAFSFRGGLNLPGKTHRFDINRLGVGTAHGNGRFRLATTTAAVTGSRAFF